MAPTKVSPEVLEDMRRTDIMAQKSILKECSRTVRKYRAIGFTCGALTLAEGSGLGYVMNIANEVGTLDRAGFVLGGGIGLFLVGTVCAIEALTEASFENRAHEGNRRHLNDLLTGRISHSPRSSGGD